MLLYLCVTGHVLPMGNVEIQVNAKKNCMYTYVNSAHVSMTLDCRFRLHV